MNNENARALAALPRRALLVTIHSLWLTDTQVQCTGSPKTSNTSNGLAKRALTNRHTDTHRHTDGTDFIPSTAGAGGNNFTYIFMVLLIYLREHSGAYRILWAFKRSPTCAHDCEPGGELGELNSHWLITDDVISEHHFQWCSPWPLMAWTVSNETKYSGPESSVLTWNLFSSHLLGYSKVNKWNDLNLL